MAAVEERSADDGVLATRPTVLEFWRTLAAGAIGGGLVGLLMGGILGRILMRVLAMTSPKHVVDRLTDDGQPVGQISLGGTVNLFITTIALGAIAGLVYLWVRRVLPSSRSGRAGLFALFVGSIGGAFLVHDHPSFDYSALKPEWLAVLSFVAIPTLFGLFAPAVIDRLNAPDSWARRGPAWLVIGVAAVMLNIALVVVAVPVIAAFVVSRSEAALRFWRSDAVTVAGKVLFALMVAWGLYGLTTDVFSIATNMPSSAPFTP